ncbi:MAG TPA: zinc ribbon domain-containing protein [Bacteroidales bacterium]|nr:zinc ribbon domain-containing protein [Bacteroidales bacterium]HOM36818.1 zinc ribbon domain-containing protein [Bacteroidales bacterium]HPD24574.1 zinc ribbon domain-containing protein [Bacteroidales bacterium]HRS99189.1 zinc ribbon domain-containing protein [Bacteroidales bacterium]HRT80627.1 zinc ribbon domain-containing protein [Bacteroidales bacterium]
MANKFCIQCGAQIPMEAQVCPVCGAPQPVVNPDPQQPMSNNQTYNQQGAPVLNPPKEKNNSFDIRSSFYVYWDSWIGKILYRSCTSWYIAVNYFRWLCNLDNN